MTTPRGISETGPSLRILLVEDEALLLMMTADMVDELGHQVVAKAGSIEQAMIVVQVADFDLAILDVNVAGKPITSIAAIIADRGLPFVFDWLWRRSAAGRVSRSPTSKEALSPFAATSRDRCGNQNLILSDPT